MALKLHMSVGELGQRMSLHELTVVWPEYFAYVQRESDREDEKAAQRRGWN